MVSVEEYLQKAYKTINLPSGFAFKVKTLSAFDILEELGDIPIIQELFQKKMDTDSDKEDNTIVGQKLKSNEEFLKKIMKVIPRLVEKCIVEPKGIKWEQLDGRDKEALVDYVISQFEVDKNTATFRQKE